MGSSSRVHYCCVSKGNQIVCASASSGSDQDREIENLAALCLENIPLYHAWYFETFGKRTYGFLVLDAYVYFAIADEALGNLGTLRFLHQVRDQFNKVAMAMPRYASSNSNYLQERFVPILHAMINLSSGRAEASPAFDVVADWPPGITASEQAALSPFPSTVNGQSEVTTSTKAPLLGRSSMHEKKKSKDHILVELEEHRRSTDGVDSVNTGRPNSGHKDLASIRNRPGSQSMKKKWWRQVRIILAIDAVVCLALFLIWLFICLQTECMK